jgi:hypothetical protein
MVDLARAEGWDYMDTRVLTSLPRSSRRRTRNRIIAARMVLSGVKVSGEIVLGRMAAGVDAGLKMVWALAKVKT